MNTDSENVYNILGRIMIFKLIITEYLNWIQRAQNRVKWFAFVETVMNLQILLNQVFLDHMNSY